jgi:hypothetical protein
MLCQLRENGTQDAGCKYQTVRDASVNLKIRIMKKSEKQISHFTLAFVAIMFCLLAVPSARSSEPVYNGKPLSEWLLILKLGYTSTGERAERADAREAIRQMGTNAIPTLLQILGANDRNKWWVLARLKSKGFREMYHNQNVPTDDLQDTGVEAFGLLGTNAISAIPKINKLFGDWETCSPAARVLAGLGPEGVAALTNGLASENDDIRGVTIWAIGEKSSMDSNTIARIMIASLKDPHNRWSAARYLGGKDPALAIPALLPLLDVNPKTDSASIVNAALSLSSYGAAAKVALPKLLSLYTNSWDIQLMWALKAIDMEAAAQAEQLMVNSGPLNKARYGYTRTKLTNGLELIAGGYIHTEFPTIRNRNLSSAELLEPKTGKWIETGEMHAPRYDHTAILQPDGKVLVTGGYDKRYGDTLSNNELYDPTMGTWTVITNK